jgi:hypothetical protein
MTIVPQANCLSIASRNRLQKFDSRIKSTQKMPRRKRADSDDEEWFPSDDERKEQQKEKVKKKKEAAKRRRQEAKEEKNKPRPLLVPSITQIYRSDNQCRTFFLSDKLTGDHAENKYEIFNELQGNTGTIRWTDLIAKFEDVKDIVDLKEQIQHGDAVFFDDYRMVITYIVYWPNPEQDDPLLIRTYEEYGYGIPVDFSDAPLEYFADIESIVNRYVHPAILWEGTEIHKKVTEEIEARKKDPIYVGQTEYDYGEQKSVNLDVFPQEYLAIFCFECGDSSFGWIHGGIDGAPQALNGSLKRYDARREQIRKIIQAIAQVFRPVLPQEIINTVVHYVI